MQIEKLSTLIHSLGKYYKFSAKIKIMRIKDIQKELAQRLNISSALAEKILHSFVDDISQALVRGEEVTYSGFGTFFIVNYPSKSINDPRGRGHKIIMLPTNVAKFRPSGQLRKKTEHILPSETVNTNIIKKSIPSLKPNTIPIPIPEAKDKLTMADLAKESTDDVILKDNKSTNEDENKINEAYQKTMQKQKKQITIQFRDISSVKVEKDVLSLIPANIARQYKVVPIELESGKLTVAMVDPENINTIELLKKTTQLDIEPVLSTTEEINGVLDQYTALQEEVEDVIKHSDLGITKKEIAQAEKEKIEEESEDSPTVRIVFSLLKRAVRERASDIHIEPGENGVTVRFRIDGVLQKRVILPKQIHGSVIARLKIMANLKIDEQRLPQDGRFQMNIDQNHIDFRFSTMPCVNGEKAVMRILDKSQGILTLEDLGLAGHGFDVLSNNIRKTHGMTLVTGPTGSGKTTTLYAVLGKLMDVGVNIVTLEDPVEYRIADINQSQINSEIGYSFASSLRTVVRQDPDIIMLGEIRDKETAEMAIHAALTGHIVLSTLHTNDAAGAIPRLIDMGIEPFLIASSVNTVVGQRLTRKLCPKCKKEFTIGGQEVNEIKDEIKKMPADLQKVIRSKPLAFYKGEGCSACGKNGYKGRQGVFEILDVSEKIKELVVARSSSDKILEQARSEGMTTMLQDGITKAQESITSMEEVWRVTRE